ncbi:MAG: zf-HC2 domain-containing protein [Candidatus Eremiobacteraeota bacterium]|nr:zf-HC2 domain-containing protein [Candidatus Eremiobacteraeota bacterium]
MMQHLSNTELIDYIHGQLAPAQDALVHTHLDACAPCRDEYAAEIALGEMLRNQAALEERELPPMLKAQIWAKVRAERPSALQRMGAFLRPAYALPIAAVVVLLAFFGPGYLHQQQPAAPSIDAAYYLQDHAAMNSTVPFGDQNGAAPAALEETAAHTDETAVNGTFYTADANP